MAKDLHFQHDFKNINQHQNNSNSQVYSSNEIKIQSRLNSVSMADLVYCYSFSLQLRKTSLDTLALLSRERAGRIIRPALLKTRSLAAELAGAVKI